MFVLALPGFTAVSVCVCVCVCVCVGWLWGWGVGLGVWGSCSLCPIKHHLQDLNPHGSLSGGLIVHIVEIGNSLKVPRITKITTGRFLRPPMQTLV